MSFVSNILAVVKKDALAETRSGEIVLASGLFSTLLVMILAFAFVKDGEAEASAAAGSLWVALTLGGTLGLARAWDREREADGLRLLLLSPMSRASLLIGKAVGITLFMTLTASVVVPLVGLVFGAPLLSGGWRLPALVFLGLVGFSLLAAFFGALAARGEARDVLLFIVLFPLLFPLLIAATLATSELFSPDPRMELVRLHMALVLAFDATVAVVALWTFDRLVTE